MWVCPLQGGLSAQGPQSVLGAGTLGELLTVSPFFSAVITSVALSTGHWCVNYNYLNTALNFCLLVDAHLFPLFLLAVVSETVAKWNFKEQQNLTGFGDVTGPLYIFLTDKIF